MRFYTKLLGKITAPFFGTGIGRLPIILPLFHWIWGILGPKDSQLVDVQGFKMYTDPKDSIIAPQLLSNGNWEPCETEIFKELIKLGMTVVDIGANIGYYTLLASRLVGISGKVYAFEPFVNTYKLLERNIEVNSSRNVIPICKAVTNRVGAMRLYLNRNTPASNSINGTGKFVVVPCTTLDSEVVDYKVDVIKMDIEGAEALAFDGMRSIIERNKHLILLTEVYPKGLKIAGSSFEEYVSELLWWFDIKVIEEKKQRLTPCESLEQIRELMSGKVLLNLVCTRRAKC